MSSGRDVSIRVAVSEYVGSLLAELIELARAEDSRTLVYLLEMARLEADNLAKAAVATSAATTPTAKASRSERTGSRAGQPIAAVHG